MKKILVVGGSYFVGRVFVLLASRSGAYDLHIVNRGNHPFKLPSVAQYVCDRRDAPGLGAALPHTAWDAVIDFCAYEPGDCSCLLSALPGTTKQYILVSTCSVYDTRAQSPKSERSPFGKHAGSDPGSVYARNKIALETEAGTACAAKDCALTVFRPTFVYGPFNYAPRESYYFERILRNEVIPHPVDATGRFSLVYVKDIAAFLTKSVGDENAFGQVYNLSAPEIVTYNGLLNTFTRLAGKALLTRAMRVAQILERDIPLPYPLTSDDVFSGDKAAETFELGYTPLETGMRESYAGYQSAFGQG